jgi:hypothetical protein
MVYFANFQHILLLSELTFCTTILVHHVLLYVMVPHGSHVRDGWDLFQREPTVASMSRHVLPYMDVPHCICEARIHFIQKGAYLRLDAVHAAINA